ncbi:MAG TPA: hypothetical protein VMV05_11170 [bacterium]|nr:hypothetical protein [bacterium]
MNFKIFFFILVALAAGAGCVDINDSRVQVQRPGDLEQYQRSLLPEDKCSPHTVPHRLIRAQTTNGSILTQAGAQFVNNQQDFDKWWPVISPEAGWQNNMSVSSLTGEPVINWDQETAYFVLCPISNSCQKISPDTNEMDTDCFTITVHLREYRETQNCQAPVFYPVFVYIYSKTNLPVNVVDFYPTPTPTVTFTPTATSTPRIRPTPTPESEDE